ncbi:ABC transporter permease [Hyphococcus sp.]|uniref:ABC transporter permease n=1 Tax=Hyphococcus sp. TaxID=2038636 RepID=UPI0035C6E1E9
MGRARAKKGGWRGAAAILLIAIAAAAPIAAVLAGAGSGGGPTLFVSDLGLRYLTTTLLLCGLAGAGAGIIGAGASLLVSLADFPGRKTLAIALALPFAIPAYVAAYAYGDLFGPFGPVAETIGIAALPEIRSLPGAAFVLMLTTYPYIYLAMRASLASRSGAIMEAARSLGASPMRASLGLLLTASRPAFFGGLALALMEIAADYGVADFFGVQTLSVGIFRTWHGLGDLHGAMQLAAGLFLVALILVLMESASRKGRASEDARAQRKARRIRLSPAHGALAFLLCLLPVLFGFVAPAALLLSKFEPEMNAIAMRNLMQAGANTALIAAAGAAIAVFLSLLLAYSARAARGRIIKLALRAATLGYAVPGAVMAIGVLALSASIARVSGYALAGGVLILLYAYVARFLTAGYNAAAGGLAQISPQMDGAARTLGAAPGRIVRDLHWPMARLSLLAGAAIVAIDITKELPATLILRPFNFETLSTQIYRLASDERLADAAPAALILIALGLLPSIALSVIADSEHKKTRKQKPLAGPEPNLTGVTNV